MADPSPIRGSPARTNPSQVADAAVAAWQTIHASLSPVLGARGADALFQRCLHLAGETRPWLAAAKETQGPPGDFFALHGALAARDPAEAAAAQAAMVATLHEMLDKLIGPSLTARLLPAGPGPTAAGHAVQDPLP